MKKLLSIIIILLFLPVITAANFECSDKSEIKTDQKEIKEGEAKTILGLGIGVIDADEVTALSKVTANLMVDAISVELSNQSSIQEIELLLGDYTVTLKNSSLDEAQINIDGSEFSITKEEVEIITELSISLSSISTDATETIVKLIIGANEIFLSSNEEKWKKFSSGNHSYVVELSSASDKDARLKVYLCNSGTIQEIATQTTTNINNTAINISNSTGTDEILNESNNTEPELSINQSDSFQDIQEIKESSFLDKVNIWILVVIIIVAAIIFIILIFLLFKKPKEDQLI